MKGFWTCGPFKEAEDNLARMVFKAEQMKIFMDVLEEAEQIEKILENGSSEEKLLASLVQLDVDKKLDILLGVPDGNEKENDEISGETVLESLQRYAKR